MSQYPEYLNTYYNSFFSSVATTTSSSDVIVKDPCIVHSKRHALTGFAAMFSVDESKALEKEEVISVRPETILSLQTTHSPSFLRLNQNIGLWSGSNYGKGVIIGLLDFGISPDHPSFSEHGMPPPPAKWKVKSCQFMTNFTCNNKIIGTRSFMSKHKKTAFDDDGHDTHTSSTAAGNFVKGANIFGNANGTASGISPHAHLAIYRVCNASRGYPDSAIIAGMDAAIEDGVDVLSISLGGSYYYNFYDEMLAIGAFRAMEKGIFVSLIAGNRGPYPGSVEHGVPWALTVGASTIDREIKATIVVGNNRELHGQTAFQPKTVTKELLFPLVYVSNCSNFGSLSLTNIKSAHPDWSLATIKSAIMTTADVVNHAHGPIEDETFVPVNIFATGAGHVNPAAASDPGLIYDIKPEDYIPYLCGLNFTDEQVRLFTKNKAISFSQGKSIPKAQLNYPSFTLTFTGRATNPQTYTRTVTNVGDPHSSYNVTVVSPHGIKVRVAPKKLNFSKSNQKMNYSVTFSRKASSALNDTSVKGYLKLCSSKKCVTKTYCSYLAVITTAATAE